MMQKQSNFAVENWAKDTNWRCIINLNSALIINVKIFDYTGNQKCKLLQSTPLYVSKKQMVQRIKVPETEGSVGMSVHLQSLQEATFPENILAIYFTSMPSNTT